MHIFHEKCQNIMIIYVYSSHDITVRSIILEEYKKNFINISPYLFYVTKIIETPHHLGLICNPIHFKCANNNKAFVILLLAMSYNFPHDYLPLLIYVYHGEWRLELHEIIRKFQTSTFTNFELYDTFDEICVYTTVSAIIIKYQVYENLVFNFLSYSI